MTGPISTPNEKDGPTRRRSSKVWLLTLIILAIAILAVSWQRVSSRSEAADQPAVKPTAAAPTDLVVLDERNLQQVSTEPVQEKMVSLIAKRPARLDSMKTV